jgi:diacylglycerol kinase (ATP)
MTRAHSPDLTADHTRPTSATVIVNPMSGRGRHEHQIRAHATLATELLASLGVTATVLTTEGRGDAHRFAKQAADGGVDLVIAWGGDGTVNEAASALVHRGVPLGIVPAGSGNGLASDLRLPFMPTEALRIAVTGKNLAIDAAQVHESWFFNIAGIGVDALIAARFAERGLRRRGPIGYLQIGVTELVRYRSQAYHITIDAERTEHTAMMIALANGRQYGNNVCIAPGARLDDGLLEMVIVEPLSIAHIAVRLPSVFLGRLKAGRGVTMRAVRALSVEADAEIPFHVDGEPMIGPSTLHVVTHPGALIVRTP